MKKFQSSENFSNKSSLSQPKKPFIEFKERVRYSEIDKMGVAHHKNYLEWFEIGRTEFCRHQNIPYSQIEARGYYLVVIEAYCKYRKPLRYDDEFNIRVILDQLSPRKIVFKYELLKDNQTIASGYTVHLVTNSKTEVCSLPPDIIEKIKAPIPRANPIK